MDAQAVGPCSLFTKYLVSHAEEKLEWNSTVPITRVEVNGFFDSICTYIDINDGLVAQIIADYSQDKAAENKTVTIDIPTLPGQINSRSSTATTEPLSSPSSASSIHDSPIIRGEKHPTKPETFSLNVKPPPFARWKQDALIAHTLKNIADMIRVFFILVDKTDGKYFNNAFPQLYDAYCAMNSSDRVLFEKQLHVILEEMVTSDPRALCSADRVEWIPMVAAIQRHSATFRSLIHANMELVKTLGNAILLVCSLCIAYRLGNGYPSVPITSILALYELKRARNADAHVMAYVKSLKALKASDPIDLKSMISSAKASTANFTHSSSSSVSPLSPKHGKHEVESGATPSSSSSLMPPPSSYLLAPKMISDAHMTQLIGGGFTNNDNHFIAFNPLTVSNETGEILRNISQFVSDRLQEFITAQSNEFDIGNALHSS